MVQRNLWLANIETMLPFKLKLANTISHQRSDAPQLFSGATTTQFLHLLLLPLQPHLAIPAPETLKLPALAATTKVPTVVNPSL